ncbi:MAG: type VI secretion system contractile sheath large subunit [Gammaproteobacteria bacterium]|nr:type VI secretion system contractile sheath large subunit [Gammaproteobacteria bacterium]MCK5262092.1 type VI secretion system contractile sheath large subunit [Gammaproteobacteria bacterium]
MAEPQNNSVDRVNLVYKTTIGGVEQEIELPFRLLVCGDFTCDERSEYFDGQEIIPIKENDLRPLFLKIQPSIKISVENKLLNDDSELVLEYTFQSIDEFRPEHIVRKTDIFVTIQNFIDSLESLTKNGADGGLADNIHPQILEILKSESITTDELLNGHGVTSWLISDLTKRISIQLDEILHDEKFSQMEAIWRSLEFLVERTDFSENCEVNVLNISKQGLMDDFEDAPEVIQSEFYRLVYSSEFGQFGGKPYGAIVGNYEFTPKAFDIKLLQRIASVSAFSHLPFIAAASAKFFSVDTYSEFSRLRDIKSIFEQPAYAKWQSFRESMDSRYIGLTLPSFLLRQPYDVTIGSINYREAVGKKDRNLLWGNSAFAFATRILSSFAKYRICLNIMGSEDGMVEGLNQARNQSNSMHSGKIPTQVLLTDKRESEVVAQGFIPLSVHKGDDTAAFYSAYSVHSSDAGKNPKEVDVSARLGSQFPYLLIISRISHYIKMMQREHIGSWTNRREIDQGLNNWLKQLVSDMDNPAPGVRARRPLRRADIKVREVDGKSDWYLTRIEITPHIKYMGDSFTLNETSKLEKT